MNQRDPPAGSAGTNNWSSTPETGVADRFI
jgi:hypothetical protein